MDKKTAPLKSIASKLIKGASSLLGGGAATDTKTAAAPPVQTAACDANATTNMPPRVLNTMLKWANRGNPSANTPAGKESRELMATFRQYIANTCKFSLDDFEIIFTSGASESNNSIINSAVRAYAARTRKMPHIITSATEHSSVLDCCIGLKNSRMAELTILPVSTDPDTLGQVDPKSLDAALQANTCLVSIMAANNETGIINNLQDLGVVLRQNKKAKIRVPFHTDAVQIFGKEPINPNSLAVDAFSVSFHKLHGPSGSGLLVVRKDFAKAYTLSAFAHIAGKQNNGLRGGTEAIHQIAASFDAMMYTMAQRDIKNANLKAMREKAMRDIEKQVPTVYLEDYVPSKSKKDTVMVVWIAPKNDKIVMPNTIFLAVERRDFCNEAARAALLARGVVCSVGSACNTGAKEPSGVVAAMDIPAPLRNTVLRFSFHDSVTENTIKIFVKNFIEMIHTSEGLASPAKASAT